MTPKLRAAWQVFHAFMCIVGVIVIIWLLIVAYGLAEGRI